MLICSYEEIGYLHALQKSVPEIARMALQNVPEMRRIQVGQARENDGRMRAL
jgi:hypothetical protein